MRSDLVSVEPVQPGVVLVTMRRQAKRNAFDDELINAMTATCAQLRDDAAVKAVVVTGGSRVFAAGADMSLFEAMEAQPDLNRLRRMTWRGKQMVDAWENLPMHTIAAVEGAAVGGGLSLALACDWRVFARDAWALVPETRLGMNFGWGTLPRLAALAGPGRAKWMSVLGRKTTAAELAAWNIAEEVSESGAAVEAALRLAGEVAALPALAPQLIKRSVNGFSHALAKATSVGDMDDMLLCMADPESAQARRQVMSAQRARKG